MHLHCIAVLGGMTALFCIFIPLLYSIVLHFYKIAVTVLGGMIASPLPHYRESGESWQARDLRLQSTRQCTDEHDDDELMVINIMMIN